MANFNLLAPLGKCDDFTISFKEPIEIKENSRIQFNWAKFGRTHKITFEDDVDILIEPQSSIPSRIPNTPATLNLNQATYAVNNKITITKGAYTAHSLEQEIQTKLNIFLGASTFAADPTNGWNTQGLIEATYRNFQDDFQNDIVLGLRYDSPIDETGQGGYDRPNLNLRGIEMDGANGFNYYYAYGNVNGERKQHYVKNSDLAGRTFSTYDNYAMSSEHFNHYGAKGLENTGKVLNYNPDGKLFVDNWYWANGFTATALKDIEDIGQRTVSGGGSENITIGLYSREYATGTGITTDLERTYGTQPVNTDNNELPALSIANDVKGELLTWLQVEIGQNYNDATQPDADYIMVKCANKGFGNTNQLGSMKMTDNIAGLTTVVCLKLGELGYDLTYVPKIYVYTYYKQNPNYNKKISPTGIDSTSTQLLDESKLFFCVGLLDYDEGDGIEKFRPIFDSGSYGFENQYYFDKSFFNHFDDTLGPNQSALQVNTQLPFNLIMSAQYDDDGWCDIAMKQIAKENIAYTYDDFPTTIIRGVRLVIPEKLAKAIDSSNTGTLLSNWLYPLPQTYLFYGKEESGWGEHIYIKDIRTEYMDDDIAIHIESFPLNNYKNTQLSKNKGLKKNLLVVCASPFSEPNEVGNKIVAWYSPMNPFITDMKNQKFNTNNIRITIKDSQTDKPIKELTTATIDFTIFDN